MLKIEGKCPACGQENLAVNAANQVQCLNGDCPSPAAVHRLLRDARHDHVVFVGEGHWSVEHPLIERLEEGGLESCGIHDFLDFWILTEGRYTAVREEGQWQLTPEPARPPS